jgi:hypothetical protein
LLSTIVIGVVAFGVARSAPLRCPPRLPGPHPGFEQVGPVPAAHWLLWRMQLYDVPPGAAPIALAPDHVVEFQDTVIEIWRSGGGEHLLMVCDYNGSRTLYQARLAQSPARCILHNDNGLTQAWCE